MDNVLCFDDLKNNLEFLSPEDIIDLFPSKEDFHKNIGGVVAVTLLPRVMQTTMKNPNIAMTRSQQLKHARYLMTEFLANEVYSQVASVYKTAMNKNHHDGYSHISSY